MKLKLNEDYDARTRLNEYYPIIRDNLHAVEDCINIHSDELEAAAEAAEKHRTSETLDHPDGSVTKLKLSEEVRGMIDGAGSHGKDKNNPHGVTKEQVGLGNVDNVKQASKTEFDALAETTDGLDGRISDVEEECANAGKTLDEIIAIQKQLISNGGLSTGASAGDMYKFVYDTDNDGTVDKAECDAGGNDIVETYATKTEAKGYADTVKDEIESTAAETYVTKTQAEVFAVKEHKHSAEDISSGVLPISCGGTGAETPEGARESLGAAYTFVKVLQTTVDSWMEENGMFKQTAECAELLSADNPILDVCTNDSADDNKLFITAWSHIVRAVADDGSITLYADEIPDVAFNFNVKVVR